MAIVCKNLGFTRADIPKLTVAVLRASAGSRPDVRLLNVNGRLVVIKDYAAGANLFKRNIGRILIAREYAAYQRLRNIPEIPECLGCLDPETLVLEYAEAEETPSVDPSRLTPEFFVHLLALIEQLHARGIAHGDLKKLANILIDRENQPVLIDFTAAILTGSNPLAALALPYVFEDDIRAVYKLKKCCAPTLLTEEEAVFLERMSPQERVFRSVRECVRQPVKRLSSSEQ